MLDNASTHGILDSVVYYRLDQALWHEHKYSVLSSFQQTNLEFKAGIQHFACQRVGYNLLAGEENIF